jgi:hypothetical protein
MIAHEARRKINFNLMWLWMQGTILEVKESFYSLTILMSHNQWMIGLSVIKQDIWEWQRLSQMVRIYYKYLIKYQDLFSETGWDHHGKWDKALHWVHNKRLYGDILWRRMKLGTNRLRQMIVPQWLCRRLFDWNAIQSGWSSRTTITCCWAYYQHGNTHEVKKYG